MNPPTIKPKDFCVGVEGKGKHPIPDLPYPGITDYFPAVKSLTKRVHSGWG